MVLPTSLLFHIRSIHATLPIVLAILFAWICVPVLADTADPSKTDWSVCGEPYQPPQRPVLDTRGGEPGATYLFSDEVDLSEKDVSVLSGNVQVRQGDWHISADTVRYNQELETVDAQGNVQAWDIGRYMVGDFAHVDLAAEEYQVENAKFVFLDRHGYITADRVMVEATNDRIKARNATFTTCNVNLKRFLGGDFGNKDTKAEDWLLTARKIKFDKAKERVTARDVTIRVKDVPVLYSPYLTFSLNDERKTGFLMPSVGVSDETGTEVTIPFYWNIAPNQDATIGVRGMSSRGVLLQGEYRYLTRRGGGKIEGEYLPDDNKYDEYRAAFHFRHTGHLFPRLHTDIDFNWVSDEDYFEDMGTSLDISSTRFLERRIDVHYSGDKWWAMGRLQGYQTIDKTIPISSRPYRRLPQIQFGTSFPERNRRLNFQFRGEVVNFHRRAGATGTRIDVTPSISYPIHSLSSYFVPKFSLRHTAYLLKDSGKGEPSSPERTLPIFSLDSGLFLERNTNIGGRSFIHTLEPRLYYLAVGYKDQDDLPLFDTGEYTISFDKMFRENRFNGIDRHGDANQVTLALTTRLLDEETADEVLRASIGQIRYLRDQRVQLPNVEKGTDDSSEIIADVAAKIAGDWRFLAGIKYSVENNHTAKSNVNLRYRPDGQHVFNIGYRYDRKYDEQARTSFRWPLTDNLGAVGRVTYAMPESRTIESTFGLEYNSCCWASRAVVQRFLSDTGDDFNHAFFVQLELKGLVGVGKKTGAFLTEIVPGYQNEF